MAQCLLMGGVSLLQVTNVVFVCDPVMTQCCLLEGVPRLDYKCGACV